MMLFNTSISERLNPSLYHSGLVNYLQVSTKQDSFMFQGCSEIGSMVAKSFATASTALDNAGKASNDNVGPLPASLWSAVNLCAGYGGDP